VSARQSEDGDSGHGRADPGGVVAELPGVRQQRHLAVLARRTPRGAKPLAGAVGEAARSRASGPEGFEAPQIWRRGTSMISMWQKIYAP
jgi:hypothetical protein